MIIDKLGFSTDNGQPLLQLGQAVAVLQGLKTDTVILDTQSIHTVAGHLNGHMSSMAMAQRIGDRLLNHTKNNIFLGPIQINFAPLIVKTDIQTR